MKDQYAHYSEQIDLANEGSKFPKHKLVERSDKAAGAGAEEHNDHKVVSIDDAKDSFNKNLILCTPLTLK